MERVQKIQVFDMETYRNKIRREKPEIPLTDRGLTAGEVAEKVGVSRTTLYRWIKNGNFPTGKRFSEGSVRWLESAVDAWMNSRKG